MAVTRGRRRQAPCDERQAEGGASVQAIASAAGGPNRMTCFEAAGRYALPRHAASTRCRPIQSVIDYKTANATDPVSTAIAQSRYVILRDYRSTRGRLSVTLTQQALVPNPAQTNDYAQ